MAIHDPGKIITDLALSLALGGDCLADLAVLRAEPGVYGRVLARHRRCAAWELPSMAASSICLSAPLPISLVER